MEKKRVVYVFRIRRIRSLAEFVKLDLGLFHLYTELCRFVDNQEKMTSHHIPFKRLNFNRLSVINFDDEQSIMLNALTHDANKKTKKRFK